MAEKLLLIDASSSIFRAFYALPLLTNRAGLPTNAILGFVNMLHKALRESRPEYVVVVWDAPGPSRRKRMYGEYKANRDASPEDLRVQFEPIRQVVQAYRIATAEHPGEEADDVIATLALQAAAEGVEVEIASTDKDLMQLVGERITLVDSMKGRRYGPAEVEERFGVPPSQMLDLRALVGDSSDNIPGVKGIGEKGAAKLIAEFGSLDALLDSVDRIGPKRPREALRERASDALLSRDLSRLRTDLPIAFERDRMSLPEPDRAELARLFGEFEFKRLLEELGEPAADPADDAPELELEILADEDSVGAFARTVGDGPLGLGCVLEPDDAMTGELVAIVLSPASGRAVAVDMRGVGEAAALAALEPLLGDPERRWLGYRLKRDAVALGRRGIELAGTLSDAGVAAYVADPAQSVDRPEALVGSYLGRVLPAPEDRFGKGAKRRPATQVPFPELAGFYGGQLASAHALQSSLESALGKSGQRSLYRDLEVPLTRVLAKLERAGVRVDEERLRELSQTMGDRLAESERRIHALAGEEFNIGSPKQLQRILFEKLALPPSKRTKTGFSTDESVLEDLAVQYELPGEILAHRRLSKLKSTYVDALPELVHPETGRIHGRFNQTVAATGRLSSSHPNLQNIPVRTPEGRQIRRAFVPAEGCVLVSADYSQIELRILAHLSRDQGLLQAFREGADIHVRTASQVFGTPPGQVDDEQRSRTKAINFGIVYGQGPFGLARNLKISQADAREHIRHYFEQYPGVRRFLDDSKQLARERGYAETLAGRRRYLPDLASRNRVQRQAAERMATNSVIQGTAADIIKLAMLQIDAELARSGLGARMILQVHDELVFEVVPDQRSALEALVVEKMNQVEDLSVPLEVHVGSGTNWLEAH
ncbi:MAG: DNA polymerase I [Proteobacteria bacterium]|nr:DNA polymerase I [Pseudomonadota bacterium]